jgi:hypothetical protein
LALRTGPDAAGSLVALADRIELWSIDRLRPYERNPRTHSEAQVDQIAASMVEFGWTNPILIDESAGILRWQEFSGGTATLDGDGRSYKEIAAGRTMVRCARE